ncbi:caspase family protein [Oligoflexaceae bacterium]|nr:caspase family protein [Oligoflexaceae bacterium]
MQKILIILAFGLVSVSCKKNLESKTKGLTDKSLAGNVAVLIGAPTQGPNFLLGVDEDVRHLSEVLTATKWNLYQKIAHQKDVQGIISAVKDGASRLTPEGTLLIAFSGHGSRDGMLFDNNSTPFQPKILVEALRDFKFKRLIFLIDACFSGQFVRKVQAQSDKVNGGFNLVENNNIEEGESLSQMNSSMINAAFAGFGPSSTSESSSPLDDILGGSSRSAGGFSGDAFSELLVISASRHFETAGDAGDEREGNYGGGRFTTSFISALVQLHENENAKIIDVLNLARKQLIDAGDNQVPTYRDFPSGKVLNDFIWDKKESSPSSIASSEFEKMETNSCCRCKSFYAPPEIAEPMVKGMQLTDEQMNELEKLNPDGVYTAFPLTKDFSEERCIFHQQGLYMTGVEGKILKMSGECSPRPSDDASCKDAKISATPNFPTQAELEALSSP